MVKSNTETELISMNKSNFSLKHEPVQILYQIKQFI